MPGLSSHDLPHCDWILVWLHVDPEIVDPALMVWMHRNYQYQAKEDFQEHPPLYEAVLYCTDINHKMEDARRLVI